MPINEKILKTYSVGQRIRDSIMQEYRLENKKESPLTTPQLAREMLQKGYKFEDVVKKVELLNSTSNREFPLTELEKMAHRMGIL